jgi:hypothetical protein
VLYWFAADDADGKREHTALLRALQDLGWQDGLSRA